MIFSRKPSPVKFKWHYWKPDDVKVKWLEDDIQSYIVIKLDDWLCTEPGAFRYHCDLAGVKLTPRAAAKAKALGMKKGVPDLHFYLPRGTKVVIELKTTRGYLKPEQKAWHADMVKLGHKAPYVVKAKTPKDGWEQVLNILHREGV